MKKDRTHAVLKEILLSRDLKTLTPVLTVNTKAHLMHFNLMSEYKTRTWKLHIQKCHLDEKT